MTITVTADPTFTPPRNRIDVSVPLGSTIRSIAVWRVESGLKTLVRAQPQAGFNAVTCYDYEMPYSTTITYEADVTYVTPGSAVFTETWSGFAARWTGDTGNFTASGGVLTLTTITASNLFATLTAGALLTVASLTGGMFLKFRTGTGVGTFTISVASGGWMAAYTAPGKTINTFIPSLGGASITFVFNTATTVINGVTVPYTLAYPNQLTASVAGAVGTMTMFAAGTTTTTVETSAVTSITVASGWMVHPAVPALSVPVSITDPSLIGVRSVGDVVGASSATVHEILGQATPVVSSSGPRHSDSLSLNLVTRTLAQKTALVALLVDQTPLLIRFPNPAFDWTDGFYQVGDVTRSRFAQNTNLTRRDFSLPLRAVQSPIVGQQNAGWSWNGVAAAFASWNEAASAYNTWADMAVDNRNPGY